MTTSSHGEVERKEGVVVAEWASTTARYTVVRTRLTRPTVDNEPLDPDDLDLADRRRAKRTKKGD